MCGGCLSVAYTLTGVRGNDDDDERISSSCLPEVKATTSRRMRIVACSGPEGNCDAEKRSGETLLDPLP